MKTQFYFPAPVEVVKVTNENLADVAEWCGGKVASTESRRVPGRQDSYVWVPTPKGNSISWAFPGMFITKRMVVTVKDEMKATFAVFRRDYFSRNYFDTPTEAVDKTWEKENKQKTSEKKPAATPKPRATYKSKAEIEADQKEPFRETVAQTVEEPKPDVVSEQLPVPKFRHTHPSDGLCQPDCTPRPLEGIHIFSDIRITVEAPNQKENNMEINENGVPEITEEEAAERKALAEAAFPNPEVVDLTGDHETPEGDGEAGQIEDISMADAVETVKELIPGSEVIEETDLGGDAFAGGQALDNTGDIEEHGSDGFNAGTLD